MVRAKRINRGEGDLVVERYRVPVRILLRDRRIPKRRRFETRKAFLGRIHQNRDLRSLLHGDGGVGPRFLIIGRTFYPVVTSNYRTVVTNLPEIAEKWISDMKSTYHEFLPKLLVGFQIQKEDGYLATMTFTVGTDCLLYQPTTAGVPEVLREFLANSSYRFVSLDVRGEELVETLEGSGLKVANLVLGEDLIQNCIEAGTLARRLMPPGTHGWKQAAIYSDILRSCLEKPNFGPNTWYKMWLTEDQVGYAVTRSICAFRLAMVLIPDK